MGKHAVWYRTLVRVYIGGERERGFGRVNGTVWHRSGLRLVARGGGGFAFVEG